MRGFSQLAGAVAALAAVFVAPMAKADVLDDIAARGEIVIGHRIAAPPFSYVSALGEPTGLAVSLCRDAAEGVRKALGLDVLKVRYVELTAGERFKALDEGRIDILCGPTTQTLSRRETMDFSIPYFIDGSSVVFRAGPISSIEDLRGEAVGALGGTTTEVVLAKLLKERAIDADQVSYRTHADGLNALQDGEIMAYFADQAILRYQLGVMRPTIPLKFSENQFSFEPYALAMKRGETRLRLEVDRALSDVFASGRIFTHINEALGEVTLSDLALAVYQVVSLPE